MPHNRPDRIQLACALLLFCLITAVSVHSQSQGQPAQQQSASAGQTTGQQSVKAPIVGNEYILGPGDVIKIWALGMEEISDKPTRIDPSGSIDLPVLGRLAASGMSLGEFRESLLKALATQVKEPRVSIDIVEFGSQPISVMGAVKNPGVHQLQGEKTLAEVLAMAGGLADDAGPRVNITRSMKWGPIPLPTAKTIEDGKFSVADVKLEDFLSASKPGENIKILPNDVITVPRAELVYVVGAVNKAGAFPLREHETMSVLQALSLAEGLGANHAAGDSKILRAVPN